MSLLWASVKIETKKKYLKAFDAFVEWVADTNISGFSLEEQSSLYVQFAYDSGLIPKQSCRNLMACMSVLQPRFKYLGVFALANHFLKGWDKLEPTQSHLPIPQSLMWACAIELILANKRNSAAALVVGFDCYTRHGELFRLICSDVILPGDVRLVPGHRAALLLRCTKTGPLQYVRLRCKFAIAFLCELVVDKSSDALVFGLTGKSLLRDFKWAQLKLGFLVPLFVVHSLRHGSATHDAGHMSIVDVMAHGRWRSLKSVRIYVRQHTAAQLALSIPSCVQRLVKALVEGDIPLESWFRLSLG
jgi:integrase